MPHTLNLNSARTGAGWRGKALIADDSSAHQRILAAIVEGLGWEAVCVSSGVDAISACADGAFDAVLLDLHMPGIDGIDAARVIRGLGGWSQETAIVLISAMLSPALTDRARKAGVDACLPKPARPAQIAQAIRDALIVRTTVQSLRA